MAKKSTTHLNVSATEHPGVERATALFSLAISLVMFVYVLYLCHFGIDFTDEGFYLNWISQPFTYVASSTQFGFLYHPLYVLVNGDVALLRQINYGGTFLIAVYAVWLALKVEMRTPHDWVLSLSNAASFGVAILVYPVFFGLWLNPTPSYNWAALQGLIVCLIGMLMADRMPGRKSAIGSFLIGAGVWLAFMGKPTTAALLAVLVLIYLVLSRKVNIQLIVTATCSATALLFATIYYIDGGVMAFIDRNVLALEIGKSLTSHSQALFRLESILISETTWYSAGYLFALTCASILLVNWRPKFFPILGAVLAVVLSAAGVYLVGNTISFRAIPADQRLLMLVSVVTALLCAGLIQFRRIAMKKLIETPVALAVVLIVFPYAYALGTGNNYWVQMPSAVFFVLLAGLVIAESWYRSEPTKLNILAAGFVTQFLSILLVINAINSPYRAPGRLLSNEVNVSIQGRGDLRISSIHANYLKEIKLLADQSDFQVGMPVIDMTGNSPGTLHFLGARPIGLAWTLGGYPGSAAYVVKTLNRVPCDSLVKSWLLTEENGPRPIPLEILKSFGSDVDSDYQYLGSVNGPNGVKQSLYRPLESESIMRINCEQVRQNVK